MTGRWAPGGRRAAGLAVRAGLRRWAQGSAADVVAVELLVGCFAGRYARPSRPWIVPCRAAGWWSVDPDRLAVHAAGLAGEPRRVLLLAAGLISGDPWTSTPAAGVEGWAA